MVLLVGVAGFEPATPSSRTTRTLPKINKNNASQIGEAMNDQRTSAVIRAVSVPANEALLRVAAVQLPRLSAEDRAGLRKYVERDMGRG